MQPAPRLVVDHTDIAFAPPLAEFFVYLVRTESFRVGDELEMVIYLHTRQFRERSAGASLKYDLQRSPALMDSLAGQIQFCLAGIHGGQEEEIPGRIPFHVIDQSLANGEGRGIPRVRRRAQDSRGR